MKFSTYLFFNGDALEALNFYQSVFGGEASLVRYADTDPKNIESMHVSADDMQKIMHGAIEVNGQMLMAADNSAATVDTAITGNNFAVMVHADNKQQADQFFAALQAGGKIVMPMADMFWGDYFGMLVDKFGVQWMIDA